MLVYLALYWLFLVAGEQLKGKNPALLKPMSSSGPANVRH